MNDHDQHNLIKIAISSIRIRILVKGLAAGSHLLSPAPPSFDGDNCRPPAPPLCPAENNDHHHHHRGSSKATEAKP
jgi:hypothetical protein